jgi:hypothetical protein
MSVQVLIHSEPTNKWLRVTVSRIFASACTKYMYQNINFVIINKLRERELAVLWMLAYKAVTPFLRFIFPFILYKQDHHLKHPFLPWLRLQICRWGRHSSSVATSSSNLHDTRVHNQEMQFSPYSYNHPGKSQNININSMHCVKERR